jgi:hypothetical protein
LGALHHYHAIGIVEGQWAKKEIISDSEDGGVGPDRQRQGEYGDDCEARIAAELAKTEAEILK